MDTNHVIASLLGILAELTQPQPIETAPRDGTEIQVLGGSLMPKAAYPDGVYGKNKRSLATWLETDEGGFWQINKDGYFLRYVAKPTHWLPCVQVDIATLEGKSHGH